MVLSMITQCLFLPSPSLLILYNDMPGQQGSAGKAAETLGDETWGLEAEWRRNVRRSGPWVTGLTPGTSEGVSDSQQMGFVCPGAEAVGIDKARPSKWNLEAKWPFCGGDRGM
ncbi:hypothetical protein EDD15DRAFT_2202803 [Pisolithus albus]|nr:hypothetical protein EDD15DRAFT_2202803 [Pisolithus albus]